MGLNLNYTFGQTSLDEEEKEGLKIPSVSTKSELDQYEQKNIEQAIQWTIGRKIKAEKLLSEQFVKSLHKRMYSDVWKWAGQFRKSEKNIGVKSFQISTDLRVLLEDTKYWIENKSYSPDEIAIRFKHRIVSIHCFPNGNGRHSRLMADLIAEKIFKNKVFTWGQADFFSAKEIDVRTTYLTALRKADNGNFADLIKFARL